MGAIVKPCARASRAGLGAAGAAGPAAGSTAQAWACRRRVSQPFLAARLRSALDMLWPPLREEACDSVLPRPEPDFLPPCDSLFTVAHARRFASLLEVPRSS